MFLTFSRQNFNSISTHFIDFVKNMVMGVAWFFDKYRVVEAYFIIFKSNYNSILIFVFSTFSRQIYDSISPHFIDISKNMFMRIE